MMFSVFIFTSTVFLSQYLKKLTAPGRPEANAHINLSTSTLLKNKQIDYVKPQILEVVGAKNDGFATW